MNYKYKNLYNSIDSLKLLNHVYSSFISTDDTNFKLEFKESLSDICEFFEFDRGYIYNICKDPTLMKLDVQYQKPDISPKRHTVEEEIIYDMPWLASKIIQDDFIYISNTKELPIEALIESEILSKESIKSCLIFPFKNNEKLIGFMGFEKLTNTLQLSDEEIQLLKDISKAFLLTKLRVKKLERYENILNSQSILLNNSEAQLWSLKNLTVYASVNKAHAKFFGKSKSELENKNIYDVFPPEIASVLTEKNWELMQSKGPCERELEIPNYKGEKRTLLIRGKHYEDKTDDNSYIICTAEDITEQKIIQDQLYKAKLQAESANTMKGQFLATMSHEIRTPMNGIIGFLELLKSTSLSEEQKEYLDCIKSSSEILLYLINDILDFSKIESGLINIENIRFSIRSVINLAVTNILHIATEKKLKIYTNINSNVPDKLMGDPSRIRQILNNLLSNAVKFTSVGRIDINVNCITRIYDKVQLSFEIIDTGIGIHPENLDKLFKPFSQEDASTTRKYGGTGLGLAISKELVTLMSGKISVESEPKRGAKFKFTILLSVDNNLNKKQTSNNSLVYVHNYNVKKESNIEKIKNSPSTNSISKIKILLVEDNEMNRMIVIKTLAQKGFSCDIATNGVEALEAVFKKDYDIIFMDCQMPIMDGFESTSKIRKFEGNRRHTKIIAMTANAMAGDKEKCIKAGMDDYISKPIDFKKVIEFINTFQYSSRENKEKPLSRILKEFTKFTGLEEKDGIELYNNYFEYLPSALDDIEEYIKDNRYSDAQKLSHQLKGSSGNLRINSIYKLTIKLEKNLLTGERQLCIKILNRIRKILQILKS